MICKYCDQRIPNDSEYCPFCGSKIASANLRNKKGSNIVAPSSKAKRNSKKSTPIKTIIAGLFILLVLRACFSSDNNSDNNSDDNTPPSVTYSTYSDDSERTKSSAKESADVTTLPNNESESKQTTTVTTKETNKETTAVTSVTSDKKTTVTEKATSTTSKNSEKTESKTTAPSKVTTKSTTVTTAKQATSSTEPDDDIVIDDETTDEDIELDDEAELPKESETTKKQSDNSSHGDNFTKYNNPEQQDTDADYVLNTNTMKFHHPSCKEVAKIKPENYSEYYGSRDTVISWGFVPCKKCTP